MRHKAKRKVGAKFCGKLGCTEKALHRHHYLPVSQFGDNPFFVMLCETHHDKANSLVIGKDFSAVKCFSITWKWLMRKEGENAQVLQMWKAGNHARYGYGLEEEARACRAG